MCVYFRSLLLVGVMAVPPTPGVTALVAVVAADQGDVRGRLARAEALARQDSAVVVITYSEGAKSGAELAVAGLDASPSRAERAPVLSIGCSASRVDFDLLLRDRSWSPAPGHGRRLEVLGEEAPLSSFIVPTAEEHWFRVTAPHRLLRRLVGRDETRISLKGREEVSFLIPDLRMALEDLLGVCGLRDLDWSPRFGPAGVGEPGVVPPRLLVSLPDNVLVPPSVCDVRGKVQLAGVVEVAATGRVERVVVLDGYHLPERCGNLVSHMIETLEGLRFQPAEWKGQPVRALHLVSVEMELR